MSDARREPGDSAQAEILATEEAWSAAIVANDLERIASFMTEDWVIVSDSGVSTRADFLAVLASGDLTHTAMDIIAPPRIRRYGDTAVPTARATNTAYYRGQRHDADEWTTDVFVREGGRWLCVLSQITGVRPPGS